MQLRTKVILTLGFATGVIVTIAAYLSNLYLHTNFNVIVVFVFSLIAGSLAARNTVKPEEELQEIAKEMYEQDR